MSGLRSWNCEQNAAKFQRWNNEWMKRTTTSSPPRMAKLCQIQWIIFFIQHISKSWNFEGFRCTSEQRTKISFYWVEKICVVVCKGKLFSSPPHFRVVRHFFVPSEIFSALREFARSQQTQKQQNKRKKASTNEKRWKNWWKFPLNSIVANLSPLSYSIGISVNISRAASLNKANEKAQKNEAEIETD